MKVKLPLRICSVIPPWTCPGSGLNVYFNYGCVCVFAQLKWMAPDEEGLVNFLVEIKGFKYVNQILCHLEPHKNGFTLRFVFTPYLFHLLSHSTNHFLPYRLSPNECSNGSSFFSILFTPFLSSQLLPTPLQFSPLLPTLPTPFLSFPLLPTPPLSSPLLPTPPLSTPFFSSSLLPTCLLFS